jgi:hypothetical protein
MQNYLRSILMASALVLALLPQGASAERTTRNSTYTARRAAQLVIQKETGEMPKGAKIHAHNVKYLGYTKGNSDQVDWQNKKDRKYNFEKLAVWEGRERGPGARGNWKGPRGVRLAIVPVDKAEKLTPDQLVARTRVSRDLTQAGQDKVARHLRAQGRSVEKIQLGDFVPGAKNYYDHHVRLSQKPISRANGFLRYTVTFSDGSKRRYEVETIARNLVGNYTSARNSAKVPASKLLGGVFADKDVYR